jgi:hypothetical protein
MHYRLFTPLHRILTLLAILGLTVIFSEWLGASSDPGSPRPALRSQQWWKHRCA